MSTIPLPSIVAIRPGGPWLQKSPQNWLQFFDGCSGPQFAVSDERRIERRMFRPARLLRDAWNYIDKHLFRRLGIRHQVTDDDLRGDRFLLDFPAIVIGNHCPGGALPLP